MVIEVSWREPSLLGLKQTRNEISIFFTGDVHRFHFSPNLRGALEVKAGNFQFLRDVAKDLPGWQRAARGLHRLVSAPHTAALIEKCPVFLGKRRCRQDKTR